MGLRVRGVRGSPLCLGGSTAQHSHLSVKTSVSSLL